MALIHSERPSGNSAEARIYDLLASSLDDEWQVWHEPEIRRAEDEERPYRPDFILLHPGRGLFVLEVKGWTLNRIEEIRPAGKGKGGDFPSLVVYGFSAGPAEVEAPFEQLGKYIREIRQQLKKRHAALGIPAKKVGALFDGAVAFTNIGRSEAETAGDDSFEQQRKKVLTNKNRRVVYKSEIDRWEVDPGLLERTLSADEEASLALTAGKMDLMRGIVHPESCLAPAPRPHAGGLPAGIAPVDALDELRVLSQAQENVARNHIGAGHRILFGVAGSGKTMILIARARWLAMLNPAQAILVLCFNRALSLYMAKVLEDHENIDVLTFHAWVRERLGFAVEFNDGAYGAKLLAHLEEFGADKYDSILIDECQDWEPEWFKAVLHAARDPKNGDLLIVGDGSQSIYRRHGNFDWRDCGIEPQPWRGNDGRVSIVFDRNYRSTRQIVALASAFARSGKAQCAGANKGILSLLPDPAECERENGVKPKLARFLDRGAEMAFVAKHIQGLIQRNNSLDPCDFAVVYPGHLGPAKAVERYGELFEALSKFGICHVHVQGGENRNQEMLLAGNSVKVLNVKQMKGLEQRACFVIGVDDYWDSEEELLYVAMTRATDWLFLTWSGEEETVIINRLTAEPSLYSHHGDSQPMAVSDSRRSNGVAKLTISEILECLNARKIRCTYTALAKYLGIEAKDIGQKLGRRRPEASWIVGARSLRPTGYSKDELAPDLFSNKIVISTETELRQLLDNNRSDQN